MDTNLLNAILWFIVFIIFWIEAYMIGYAMCIRKHKIRFNQKNMFKPWRW